MRNDSLQQYIKLHRELTEERGRLQARLRQINDALGEIQETQPDGPAPAAGRSIPTASTPAKRRGRRAKGGGLSLRDHVLEVLKEGPKTKEEVLEAVQGRGYKFSTKNPLNSLGVILYGKNPKLNRVDGKFSLKGGAASAPTSEFNGESKRAAGSRRGKGRLSETGRKAISEAARKRWATTKASDKSGL